ncbi:hypothetical protein ACQPYH_06205 [Kribbella sp. CA-245084]|uniref:hypothetical protein n=1 Tax=Kribbella sp. CA-245084 TaxID=3239940 RepID=UPI003D914564
MFVLVLVTAAVIVYHANPWKHEPQRESDDRSLHLAGDKDVTVGPARPLTLKFGTNRSLVPGDEMAPTARVTRQAITFTGATEAASVSTNPVFGSNAYERCESADDYDEKTFQWTTLRPPMQLCVTWGNSKDRHLTGVLITKISAASTDVTIQDWHWKD